MAEKKKRTHLYVVMAMEAVGDPITDRDLAIRRLNKIAEQNPGRTYVLLRVVDTLEVVEETVTRKRRGLHLVEKEERRDTTE